MKGISYAKLLLAPTTTVQSVSAQPMPDPRPSNLITENHVKMLAISIPPSHAKTPNQFAKMAAILCLVALLSQPKTPSKNRQSSKERKNGINSQSDELIRAMSVSEGKKVLGEQNLGTTNEKVAVWN
ncbi:hypothetical protein CC78DRAFT_579585 [Lojkania enalia]|uniref:Uncharacterized protein n=1 Tax=Lojkania enalia TaxID=147567 RepID=A0A9P4KEW6_9PLEO|nr:hypothetical protein CC78DRAFT_579585 [Didymosphaeria enalia]